MAQPAAPAGGDRRPSVRVLAALAARSAHTLAADCTLLAVLEARHAAITLAWLLSAGLVVAVLAVTAWLAFVTGATVWLLGSGASWPGALAMAALLNVVLAGALIVWMRISFRELPFAATLRQLKGNRPDLEGGTC